MRMCILDTGGKTAGEGLVDMLEIYSWGDRMHTCILDTVGTKIHSNSIQNHPEPFKIHPKSIKNPAKIHQNPSKNQQTSIQNGSKSIQNPNNRSEIIKELFTLTPVLAVSKLIILVVCCLKIEMWLLTNVWP